MDYFKCAVKEASTEALKILLEDCQNRINSNPNDYDYVVSQILKGQEIKKELKRREK